MPAPKAAGPITDQTAESYAATFDTNVLGVILSMKHEVRIMQGQGSGTIINISSTYGHEGAAGASVYVGSKHAVEGITKSVALELAKSGIRVNAVAPGPTDTGMLTRFTGTPKNKSLRMRSCLSRRTKHHTSPAMFSMLMAARRTEDWNDGVDDARAACGSMKSGAKMVVVRATV
jgi:NAD(P)-dependent dehydrogenase (short-subunit alcohol dehydrogenase family)